MFVDLWQWIGSILGLYVLLLAMIKALLRQLGEWKSYARLQGAMFIRSTMSLPYFEVPLRAEFAHLLFAMIRPLLRQVPN